MSYNPNNIFAKILKKEIPCQSIYEDEYALAFHDIQPKAPIHVLVIPKGNYENFHNFSGNASDEEITGFYRAVARVIDGLPLEKGYRIISNFNTFGGQEVPHFHVHILGGRTLGPLL